MIAYHFTSVHHLPRILADGALKRVESNLSIEVTRAGPDVVWLLDSPDLGGAHHGLQGSAVDKTEVCFEVEAPDRWTTLWAPWATAQGMSPDWRRTFVKQGGGEAAAERWLICFAQIKKDSWLKVWNTKTNEVYLERKADN